MLLTFQVTIKMPCQRLKEAHIFFLTLRNEIQFLVWNEIQFVYNKIHSPLIFFSLFPSTLGNLRLVGALKKLVATRTCSFRMIIWKIKCGFWKIKCGFQNTPKKPKHYNMMANMPGRSLVFFLKLTIGLVT